MLTLVGELSGRMPTHVLLLQEGELADLARRTGATVATVFGDQGLPASRFKRWSRITGALRRSMKELEIDNLHCHSARGNRYAGPATWGTQAKLVTHQRDTYCRNYFHLGLSWADHIIAISHWVQRGLPPGMQRRATVVYNATAAPSRAQTEASASRPTGPLLVGMAGRATDDQKGADLFLDAFLSLTDSFDANATIWGVPSRDTANPFARQLWDRVTACPDDVQRRIDLQPFRSDIDLFYRSCDIIVAPSRVAEGFGRNAIEAWAWCKPIVASNHGGLGEIVSHGETGLTFECGNVQDLAEKLRTLLEDPDLCRRLGEAGRRDLEQRFLPGPHADAVEAVYRNVLGEGAESPGKGFPSERS